MVSLIWKILVRDKPESSNNRDKARLAFQSMWVAGTLGAFFVALLSNLSKHIPETAWPKDVDALYTMQLILSYGYLLWFLTYFFISNFSNEILQKARKKDLLFDIIQSLVAFFAAYKLGFLSLNLNFSYISYAYASASVFVICFLSFLLFGCESKRGINLIRVYGLIISLISIFSANYFAEKQSVEQVGEYFMLAVIHFLMWIILWPFMWIRIDEAAENPGL
ncbi:hypothetical protein [Candidatus Thiodiazotropha sp. CDECU1]|uniref:hypothetical protein n=1 Tax=Candidatus Thiodiazotropha sp. CDECU1 TaxID=3065865 RepID=UPI002931873E|nr:hypothetical protein [Candidatus Thiodiazotropha sp. CDECU1]